MKNNVILITGAAGFIGSHVTKSILERGDLVVGLDEMNDYYSVSNKERNLDELFSYKNFSFIKADIRDFNLCNTLLSNYKISRICHIAARAGVRPSIIDPVLYEEVNVKGTLNLLEIGKIHQVENFVLTSSSSVYGNSKKVPFHENDSATDQPISPYAATKKASELLGYTYHSLYGMNINVVRPFTVYGPKGRPDMAPWLFLKACIDGKAINKFGSGETKRDYTFIDDFVDGFVSATFKPFGYEVFNLGNSNTVSLNQMISTVENVVGKKMLINQMDKQAGDVDLTFASIDKAKQKLNYNPKTDFSSGMERFYEWFTNLEK